MRRALFIATTSLTRTGVEACVDFLEAVAPKLPEFWLPLPVELCKGLPVDLGPLEGYLEPLLNLYYEVRANWRCYSSAEELRRREMAAVKLAALALKARVYGRVDLREWDGYFSHAPRAPPMPSLALGALRGEEVVICGTYPPNPIEVAYEIWGQLAPVQRLELARWVAKYIALITESINLDEAYFKLLKEGWRDAYRAFTGHDKAISPPTRLSSRLSKAGDRHE